MHAYIHTNILAQKMNGRKFTATTSNHDNLRISYRESEHYLDGDATVYALILIHMYISDRIRTICASATESLSTI